MKIARIVLPMLDNQGKSLWDEHEHLMKRLLELWGGFTSYEGLGKWVDKGKVYAERIVIYDIAMERQDVTKLRTLALSVCVQARQLSVMIVTPNGDTEFVHPPVDKAA